MTSTESTQTSQAPTTDRDERRERRHAREGGQAADRVFTDLLNQHDQDPDFDAEYRAAVNLVLNGPAPQAFKDAFSDQMAKRMREVSQG